LILFVVVYGLYEISIQLVRLVERKREKELREEGLWDEDADEGTPEADAEAEAEDSAK